jgi:hypothetical protein
MSRDRLQHFVNGIEKSIVKGRIRKNEKPFCADPLCAYRFPHTKALWFVRGVNRFLSGEAKTLESALELNRRGRRVNSYKPENLELAKKARRLRKQGMTWDDVTQELFGHRRNPPSARYVQILVKRFTPAIEEEECKAMVDKCRQLLVARRKRRPRRAPTSRSETPPRWASTRGRNEFEAVWVDPTLKLTPKTLMKMLRRQARKRHHPK